MEEKNVLSTIKHLSSAIDSLERIANLTEQEISIPARLAAINKIHALRGMLRDLEA